MGGGRLRLGEVVTWRERTAAMVAAAKAAAERVEADKARIVAERVAREQAAAEAEHARLDRGSGRDVPRDAARAAHVEGKSRGARAHLEGGGAPEAARPSTC